MEVFITLIFMIVFFVIISSLSKASRYKERKFIPYHKNRTQDKVEKSIEYMSDGRISIKKIMNEEEARIYYALVRILKDEHNINPQVSFKAFLSAEYGTDAWLSFRDFYCDFLITKRRGENRDNPVAIIEYHGGGHYGDTDDIKSAVKQNDIIKNCLLEKVGIPIFIIKEIDIKSGSRCIDNERLEAVISEIYSNINPQ